MTVKQDLIDYDVVRQGIDSADKNKFGIHYYVKFYNVTGQELFTLKFDDELQANKAISAIAHNATLIING